MCVFIQVVVSTQWTWPEFASHTEKKYVTASMHKHNRITYRHNAHFHGLSEFWKNGSTNVIENVCAEQ